MVRVRDDTAEFPPLDAAHVFFNPELMPYCMHARVRERGMETIRSLSARRLADYLSTTECVELNIVNYAVEAMLGRAWVSDELRAEALAVYTDEGYHTLMMERFRHAIFSQTGYALARAPSSTMARLRHLCGPSTAARYTLAVVCCAIVTETLITTTLRKAGASDQVYPPVAALMLDHAADEGRHQAFFIRFAERFLPMLDDAAMAFVERLLPNVMMAFLAPDPVALKRDLAAVGIDDADAKSILLESFDITMVREQMMTAAVAPRRLFERLGMTCASAFEAKVARCRIDFTEH
ncbi:diiron oxygenase [Pandoraea terrae]